MPSMMIQPGDVELPSEPATCENSVEDMLSKKQRASEAAAMDSAIFRMQCGRLGAQREKKHFSLQRTQQKKLIWTPELQREFLKAITCLAHSKISPKRILHIMNVEGLTRANVASHLQKFRKKIMKQELQNKKGSPTKSGINDFKGVDLAKICVNYLNNNYPSDDSDEECEEKIAKSKAKSVNKIAAKKLKLESKISKVTKATKTPKEIPIVSPSPSPVFNKYSTQELPKFVVPTPSPKSPQSPPSSPLSSVASVLHELNSSPVSNNSSQVLPSIKQFMSEVDNIYRFDEARILAANTLTSISQPSFPKTAPTIILQNAPGRPASPPLYVFNTFGGQSLNRCVSPAAIPSSPLLSQMYPNEFTSSSYSAFSPHFQR